MLRLMRCVGWFAGFLGLALLTACGGKAQPTAAPPPPPPRLPAPTAKPQSPPTETFTLAVLEAAPYRELFVEAREWKLVGRRHLVAAGNTAGSLHYKVIVRCHVAEVVESPHGVAARVECANFPEDALAPNPIEGVWVAGARGLFRTGELPQSDAQWSDAGSGEPVFGHPLRALERSDGECHFEVTDQGGAWCFSESCGKDPTMEGKVCFAQAGGLVGIEAHSISETTDVLSLSVERIEAPVPPASETPPPASETPPSASDTPVTP